MSYTTRDEIRFIRYLGCYKRGKRPIKMKDVNKTYRLGLLNKYINQFWDRSWPNSVDATMCYNFAKNQLLTLKVCEGL